MGTDREIEAYFDYRLTENDLRFHRWLKKYVRENVARFVETGHELDRDFSTTTIREWPKEPGRVWESDEERARPEIPPFWNC